MDYYITKQKYSQVFFRFFYAAYLKYAAGKRGLTVNGIFGIIFGLNMIFTEWKN